MAQGKTQEQESILTHFYDAVRAILGKDFHVKAGDSLFLYDALEEGPEQEFIIDLEIDFNTNTAVLYQITLPMHRRNLGLGTRLVAEIEKTLNRLGIQYVSLPAEHHSTGFWLKAGYRFKFDREKQFYQKNSRRDNLQLAYELEKDLAG